MLIRKKYRKGIGIKTFFGIAIAPRRGAWIETNSDPTTVSPHIIAPRRGAWIETFTGYITRWTGAIAPRRGAWIETPTVPRSKIVSRLRLAEAHGLKLTWREGVFVDDELRLAEAHGLKRPAAVELGSWIKLRLAEAHGLKPHWRNCLSAFN